MIQDIIILGLYDNITRHIIYSTHQVLILDKSEPGTQKSYFIIGTFQDLFSILII